MTTGVDTLKLFERFRAANLDERAAREIAEAIKEVELSRLEELATKGDISRLEAIMVTKADLAEAKVDIIKWVAGMLVAQAAVIAALVKIIG